MKLFNIFVLGGKQIGAFFQRILNIADLKMKPQKSHQRKNGKTRVEWDQLLEKALSTWPEVDFCRVEFCRSLVYPN